MNNHSKWLLILCLIVAGELIFSLPFHIARYFRPTFLDVFQLSNSDLGDIFAVYGVTAMLSYYPGGVIADKFPYRKLMSLSLIFTSAGGFYLCIIPDKKSLMILFAYWGMTSILFFWAALIRATREWGGKLAQGQAFGLLDGGRGLVAALASALAVLLFDYMFVSDLDRITDIQRQDALRVVIYYYSIITLLAGLFVYVVIPENKILLTNNKDKGDDITYVFREPIIWLQAIIVICAYCGYKGLDNYALYAKEVLNFNEIESAQLASLAAFLRPVSAIAAGLLADKVCSSKVINVLFVLLAISYLVLVFATPNILSLSIIYLNIIITFVAVFAIRGVYFSLLEESQIPKNMTGTAVGLISVVGFTPDIFFAAITGRILDANPGVVGHQLFFMSLFVVSIVGIFTTSQLIKLNKKQTISALDR
ncbi:MAG: MFS transporter [Proteobacteria bacterium]|nr:MFS transporter [Pseudomonadota bacterium]